MLAGKLQALDQEIDPKTGISTKGAWHWFHVHADSGMLGQALADGIIHNLSMCLMLQKDEKIVCPIHNIMRPTKACWDIKVASAPQGDGKVETYFGATGCGRVLPCCISRACWWERWGIRQVDYCVDLQTAPTLDDSAEWTVPNAKGFYRR